MIYPYQKRAGFPRPIVPLTLKSGNNLVNVSALVDSGADYCIFSIEVAEILKIKFSPLDKIPFYGVGKGSTAGYWGKVEINFPDSTYQTKVVFAKLDQIKVGLLGQKGFFDHFDVKFSYKNQTVELTPVKP